MKKLYVIDASGYLYKSYFAIQGMSNAEGLSTNALFGFIRSVHKIAEDADYVVSVFDAPNGKKSRVEIYPEYKANRLSMPEDLRYQVDWAREFCDLGGIARLETSGFEADDVMGTLAVWGRNNGFEVYLCTSDKDLCQFVGDGVFLLRDGVVFGKDKVKEKYGVWPEQIIDFLSIMGDSSDNVPGLPGIGPKGAVSLLEEFGDLDVVLDSWEKIKGKKGETVRDFKEQALLSRQLVTINTDLDIPQNEDFFKIKEEKEELQDFYLNKNFSSLVKKKVVEENVDYGIVEDVEELILTLKEAGEVCFDTETTGLRPLEAKLVGVGFCIQEGVARYLPFDGNIDTLRRIFSEDISFYAHNVKYDLHILANYGVEVKNISFDTILADNILSAHERRHSLDYLALKYFDKVKTPIEDLIGKGKKQITMADVPVDKVAKYCCEDADYTFRLKQLLEKELNERNLYNLLLDIELPVMHILLEMERKGIFLNVDHFKNISGQFSSKVEILAKQIYALSGEEFNINSPKQLSSILFEKLEIPPKKKTKTGYSTNSDVLTSLAKEYPIVGLVLEYRSLEKLRSSYIEALPQAINPDTGRIHCTFNQFVTATGRLSAQDPNLQNIPTRTPEGKLIREGFKPEQNGFSFIAADYSQIELRVLAHLSGDENLIAAFNKGEDIHSYTAAQIFNIPLDEVTKQHRYQAKAVNFGIVYGQQAFGLSQELGISRKEAAEFINRYFQRYSGVYAFIAECQNSAYKEGKAVTLMGRERLIPEINSKNALIRGAAERLAINSPIQGSAADIIKLAMIEVQKKLKGLMVLQIHDELIFEVPDDQLDHVSSVVREAMENVISMRVPLLVNLSFGKNWKKC
jgi:DNA polymerase I